MILSLPDINLFYEKTGQGPPVVLLHGNGEDHTIFAPLVKTLAQTHTLYALDSRGHGQSGGSGAALSYEQMAEDAAAFIQTLHLEPPVLLGFSDGAIVGLLVALRYPTLLAKLVSCGANTNPKELKKWFLLLIRLGYLFTRDPKLKLMLTQPNITQKQLANISIPTLVLAASRDILYTRYTKQLAANIPNSRLRILPGETHASYILHSNRLCAALQDFL